MVGWHHRINGHEFEQTPGDSEGRGSLACCSPWGFKESDMTEQLKNKAMKTPGCAAFVSFNQPLWTASNGPGDMNGNRGR